MTLYVPVPRGKTLTRATPARRPGLRAWLWGALCGRPVLPAYASAAACQAAHPTCTPWRITVEELTHD